MTAPNGLSAVREILIPTLPLYKRGKVREVYDCGAHLLIVATDRVSAFDVVLDNPIPGKGIILTKISLFWFNYLKHIIPHHLISANPDDYPSAAQSFRSVLEGRSVLVRKAQVIPFECVVRGYLAGSGWREYEQNQSVCGITLPSGYRKCDRLKEPIFTPATKAETGHDENVSFEVMEQQIGAPLARSLRDISIKLYTTAAQYLLDAGIILADTKFEFGLYNNTVILIDEVITPDSSRMWLSSTYKPGIEPENFDKQYIRDWLAASGWDKVSPPPALPLSVIAGTVEKYQAIHDIILKGKTS